MNDINHQEPVNNAARKLDRRPLWRLLVFWALCIATFLMIWQFLTPEAAPSVAFSHFMSLVRADADREPHVQEVSVRGRGITFWVRSPGKQGVARFTTIGPERMEGVLAELDAEHVTIGYEIDIQQRLIDLAFPAGVTGLIAATMALVALTAMRRQLAELTERLTRAEREIARSGESALPRS